MSKSRRAPEYARRAAAKGADVLFVWGGDGTVQRCIDAVAGTDTAVAILPAGTANLLAANLRIPHDLAEAVRVGLHGDRRRLDTGSVNGERFTVMAGAGFDARMISDADRSTKDRLGRAAYVVTGVRNLGARRVKATVEVDGTPFYKGKVSCVLAANVGKILGGIEAFPEAQPDDGRLELGVVTAGNPVQWARTFARLAGPGRRVPLGQGHAGEEVQHPVRPEGPLRARWRRAPGQQEAAHQGPSRLGHGLRPVRAPRIDAVAAVSAQVRLACRRWWFWSRSHPDRVAGAVSRLWSPAFRRSRPRGMRPERSSAFSFGLMSIVVAVSQSAANSRLPRISVG